MFACDVKAAILENIRLSAETENEININSFHYIAFSSNVAIDAPIGTSFTHPSDFKYFQAIFWEIFVCSGIAFSNKESLSEIRQKRVTVVLAAMFFPCSLSSPSLLAIYLKIDSE